MWHLRVTFKGLPAIHLFLFFFLASDCHITKCQSGLPLKGTYPAVCGCWLKPNWDVRAEVDERFWSQLACDRGRGATNAETLGLADVTHPWPILHLGLTEQSTHDNDVRDSRGRERGEAVTSARKSISGMSRRWTSQSHRRKTEKRRHLVFKLLM